jgi:hypothetical protein
MMRRHRETMGNYFIFSSDKEITWMLGNACQGNIAIG